MSKGQWSHAWCGEPGCEFRIYAYPRMVRFVLWLHKTLTGHVG